MALARDIAGKLRAQIFRELHVGKLKVGDRLPSCRELAGHVDADHRTVAQAYRVLEGEGVVEIRPRSGVYVAHQERLGRGGIVLAGTARWFRDIAVEGWLRDIPVTSLPKFLERCLAPGSLKCTVVDSVVDAVEAVAEGLSRGLGFPVETVLLPRAARRSDGPGRQETEAFDSSLLSADLLVTAAFHADDVEAHLARLSIDRTLVVFSINREWPRPFHEAIRKGGLTVVHVDPQLPERFRLLLDDEDGSAVRFLTVDEFGEVDPASLEGAVHITLAARRIVSGEGLDQVGLPASLLSKDTIREVTEAVIRITLGASEL